MSNQDKDISVIIPNYNQGHLIENALNSVWQQSYPLDRIEIIVVDDGSTDNSVKTIQELINTAVRKCFCKLLQKDNGGTASARNLGIKESKAPYIALLDADDIFFPNKIERSLEEIKRYDNVGCVYSDYIERKRDGSEGIELKYSFNKKLLLESCIVSTNSIISREAFNTINGYDEEVKGCEDYDLWLRLSNSGYFIRHIPEPLFLYNNHGENKTNTYDKEEWRKEVKRVVERAKSGVYSLV